MAIGMGDFDSVWGFPLERVDDPNKGRGGWSEVCRYPLPEPIFGVKALYVKRQQDFVFLDWRKPIKGLPTFQREFNNIAWCLDHDIPVVKPAAFGVRDHAGHRQAILITQALADSFSLGENDVIERLGIRLRRAVIRQVARLVRRLHKSGKQHGCLYPKHIFVNNDCHTDQPISIHFLDLEKMSSLSFWNKGIYRDLDTLNRRAYGWNSRDRHCFLLAYCDADKNKMRDIMRRLEE